MIKWWHLVLENSHNNSFIPFIKNGIRMCEQKSKTVAVSTFEQLDNGVVSDTAVMTS